MNLKLSQSTIEKLGYYVYLLIDPRNKKVFYVGKGVGNRVYQHVLGSLKETPQETNKIKIIRDLQNNNLEVKHYILRHGLTEKEAFEVESAVIDLILVFNRDLTNIVKGFRSEDRGIMTLDELKIKYEAEEAVIDEPIILININNLFRKDMGKIDLYEATRKHWKININRVKNIKIACAVFRGIIREVYTLDKWGASKEKGRYMFEGKVASNKLRDKYIYKSVSKYWKQGSQNPIKYVNG